IHMEKLILQTCELDLAISQTNDPGIICNRRAVHFIAIFPSAGAIKIGGFTSPPPAKPAFRLTRSTRQGVIQKDSPLTGDTGASLMDLRSSIFPAVAEHLNRDPISPHPWNPAMLSCSFQKSG